MNRVLRLCFVLFFMSFTSALGLYAQQTECIKLEQDGSMTVRVTGVGRNKTDALSQAKKQALLDVIFRGSIKGTTSYYRRPLLTAVNAREKYQEYFDIFFTDGGEFEKYVSMVDKRTGSTYVKRSSVEVECRTTVRVLIPQLKQRFKDDGIIK